MLRDRQIVEDLIKDERFLNVCETFCAVEASPQLKSTLLDIQREEQDMHTRLYQYAQRQGWYPTLWGDMGFQAQAAGVGAGPGAISPQAPVQPWISPQQAGGFAAQPAGGLAAQQAQQPWQQQGWQQPWQQTYTAGGFQAGPVAAMAAAPGRFGTQPQATGTIQVAGREYGPY